MTNAVEYPKKKLTEAPAMTARRMAEDGNAVVPSELLDASVSQRKALLTGLRNRVGVRRDESAWPLSDTWLLGSREQAESVASLLESVGVEAALSGAWSDERSGGRGEGVLVRVGALEEGGAR